MTVTHSLVIVIKPMEVANIKLHDTDHAGLKFKCIPKAAAGNPEMATNSTRQQGKVNPWSSFAGKNSSELTRRAQTELPKHLGQRSMEEIHLCTSVSVH